MQRQGLNIEEVDHDQHCEQDQLAPLRGVTEEELDVFQDELALGDGEPAEQRAHRPAPEPTTNEALCPFLRLRKPLCVQGAVQHRAERDECEHGVQGEQHATLVHDAVGRQDRHDHQRHHPRRMQQRLTQLGEIQPQPVHRGRDEQVEVLGEEEARERRDDVRQHQDGYEGKQNEPEDLARDERSQLFDSAEIAQDEKQHAEDACPERPSDNDQNDELAAAALGALFPQPLQRGPPFGLQHVGERRLLDHVPPNTSTRSRTWAPPVSLRNSSSRLASPAWCWRRTSLTVPAATVLPCWMIAIWSHIASATSRVCVLMSTVPPRSTNCRKMSLRSRAALGSRPTIGSSTTMHSGR